MICTKIYNHELVVSEQKKFSPRFDITIENNFGALGRKKSFYKNVHTQNIFHFIIMPWQYSKVRSKQLGRSQDKIRNVLKQIYIYWIRFCLWLWLRSMTKWTQDKLTGQTFYHHFCACSNCFVSFTMRTSMSKDPMSAVHSSVWCCIVLVNFNKLFFAVIHPA